MPSIRDRLTDALLGPEKRKLEDAGRIVMEAYRLGPTGYSPDQFVAAISELDSRYMDYILRHLNWTTLSTAEPGEADRQRVVAEMCTAYNNNPLIEHGVNLWTNYGFDEKVEVRCTDETAQAWWDEFWRSDRNRPVLSRRRIQDLSRKNLTYGETFFAFYVNRMDGKSTVRLLPPGQIVGRVTDPQDADLPVWYLRAWTDDKGVEHKWAYPDWEAWLPEAVADPAHQEGKTATVNPFAEPGQTGLNALPDWEGTDAAGNVVTADSLVPKEYQRADKQAAGTFVCVMPAIRITRSGWRGWPLMTTGLGWGREHDRFRWNRAAVADSVAMYVREAKSKGGSRGVEALRSKLGSTLSDATTDYIERNPPAAPGSTLISNDAVDWKPFPLSTSAGDAKLDGEALARMVYLSAGMFPHYFGEGDAYRLATATAMEGPLLHAFTAYREFWASVWEDIARVVLTMAEAFGKAKFATTEVLVSQGRLLQVDLAMLSNAIQGIVRDMLIPAVEAGWFPEETAQKLVVVLWRSFLDAAGVEDVDEIIRIEDVELWQKQQEQEEEQQEEEAARRAAALPQAVPPGTVPPQPQAGFPPAAAPAAAGATERQRASQRQRAVLDAAEAIVRRGFVGGR